MMFRTQYVKFTCGHLSDACFIVDFLANEACWFEFLPEPDDTYAIAVEHRVEPTVSKLIAKHQLEAVVCR